MITDIAALRALIMRQLVAADLAARDGLVADAMRREKARAIERQRLILSWHTHEFVLLSGDRFILATRDEEAAFSALDGAPEDTIVVPPEPERYTHAPPARGRGAGR